MPVVAHHDVRLPPILKGDLDGGGTRVKAVLDEFLDHAGRTFDDLAGGNLVAKFGREYLNDATRLMDGFGLHGAISNASS
ncbi:hypothetical protein DDE01_20830 [Desulfovibrio desulfuricans]|nr:hypothetical protein DDE01_20830 [Desulfovibrio desulfuricans]